MKKNIKVKRLETLSRRDIARSIRIAEMINRLLLETKEVNRMMQRSKWPRDIKMQIKHTRKNAEKNWKDVIVLLKNLKKIERYGKSKLKRLKLPQKDEVLIRYAIKKMNKYNSIKKL